MAAPVISGLHHFKMPVADLDASLAWYQKVFDADHHDALDHVDSDGIRFATIVSIPGLPFLVELRWAPTAAHALRECDLIVIAVDTADQLDVWVRHLDALDVEHSPVLTGGGGSVVVIVDPDGKFIRLMITPAGGLQSQSLRGQNVDPQGPWLNAAPMRHPGGSDTAGNSHAHER